MTIRESLSLANTLKDIFILGYSCACKAHNINEKKSLDYLFKLEILEMIDDFLIKNEGE